MFHHLMTHISKHDSSQCIGALALGLVYLDWELHICLESCVLALRIVYLHWDLFVPWAL
jgi:hypothetical protein